MTRVSRSWSVGPGLTCTANCHCPVNCNPFVMSWSGAPLRRKSIIFIMLITGSAMSLKCDFYSFSIHEFFIVGKRALQMPRLRLHMDRYYATPGNFYRIARVQSSHTGLVCYDLSPQHHLILIFNQP